MQNQDSKIVIAIDGPSGVGKSTTSKALAERLKLAYLDTGSIYRALAWWCQHEKIAAEESEAVVAAAKTLPIEVRTGADDFAILLAGQDVTDELHEPWVSACVSGYSNNRPARNILTELMRSIIANSETGIVVEGRDITTVVAPDAPVKVLLTAAPEVRIARRDQQLAGKISREQLAKQVIGRDKLDAKSSDFEQAAPGVTLIDSSNLTLDQVVDKIIALI